MSDNYLLITRGLYECPDHRGYTGIRDYAGRYSLEEAERFHSLSHGKITFVHENEAEEFLPAAQHDLVIKHLVQQRDDLRRQLAEVQRPDQAAAGADSEIQDLDARMVAAGMIPLTELLSGNLPLDRWRAHVGVRDLDSFGKWLETKHREYMRMRVKYELGDKSKDDEMFEWVFAHAAAYGDVIANYRQVLISLANGAGHA